MAGTGVVAADQRRHVDRRAVAREPVGQLRFRRQPRHNAGEHLRRPVGIGNRDHETAGSVARHQQQSLGGDSQQHFETDRNHRDVADPRDFGPERFPIQPFREPGLAKLQSGRRDARIDGSDDRLQSLAVRSDTLLVGGEAAVVAVPQRSAARYRRFDLAHCETLDAVHHDLIQGLVERQRLGAGRQFRQHALDRLPVRGFVLCGRLPQRTGADQNRDREVNQPMEVSV